MPDMPVPLPRMCSVLAHELRSPLSVLQGYIRLLQRQREPNHPEAAMLDAMLASTGRLTTLARQAADLGNWLAGASTRTLAVVTAREVLDVLAGRFNTSPAVAAVSPDDGGAARHSLRADLPALAEALVALVESLHREDDAAIIEISMAPPEPGGGVVFVLHPQCPADAVQADAARPAAARSFAFDRGGSGLALIAASHVLAAHGASVAPASVPRGLVVRFPHTGGVS